MEKTKCIYEDVEYKKEMRDMLNEISLQITEAIKVYKDLTNDKLDSESFKVFLKNPLSLVKKVIHKNTEIPKGFNKEKYLELLEIPDCSKLTELLKYKKRFRGQPVDVINERFFTYKNNKVEFTKNAISLINENDITLNEKEYEIYLKIQDFLNSVNKAKKEIPNFFWLIELKNNILIKNGDKYEICPEKFSKYYRKYF
jgi:hypothetical protein